MTQYNVSFWWTTLRGVNEDIEADTPEQALAKAEAMIKDDDLLLQHNKEYDDSDGPTQITVFDGAGQPLATTEPRDMTESIVATLASISRLAQSKDFASTRFQLGSLAAMADEARAALTNAPVIVAQQKPPAPDPLTQQAVAFIEKMAMLEIETDYFADGDAVADLCALVHEARAITGKQPSPRPEPETRPYRVKWEIDVEAATPEDAARRAREMQRDHNTIAGVFEVVTETGNATLVDLDDLDGVDDDCEPRIEPDGAGD